ncbi:TldD/PmbA family protein [Spirochaetota bacterium]
MKEITREVSDRIKSIIASQKCDYCEIRLSSSFSTSIVLSGEVVDSISSGEFVGGSARILNNGGWGFVSFNNLDDIEKFARRGIDISSNVDFQEKSGVIKSVPIKQHFKTPKNIDFNEISIEEKFNLMQGYNNILKSSKHIQTTRAVYRDLTSTSLYLNSEGSEITYDKSFCGVSLSSIAKDGSIIQPFHNSISGYGGYEIVQNRENIAEDVLKIAVDLLKAQSVDGGKYQVIADPKLSGVFIHEAFGHLSEADFVHENEQMRKLMVMGDSFGPEELNVIDDGSIEGLSGYIPVDDEGIYPQKTNLIKDGILSGRLHSRETAFKMKEEPSGNGRAMNVMRQPIVRMSNTYIDNGNSTKEEIFDSVKNGIYAIDLIGGQTNLEMFTFTSGYGYEIKNGKPGKIFKDIVLSGNVFNTLKNINMIGNDMKMFGGLGGCGKDGQGPLPVSFGGPHVLIDNVLIGGKQ